MDVLVHGRVLFYFTVFAGRPVVIDAGAAVLCFPWRTRLAGSLIRLRVGYRQTAERKLSLPGPSANGEAAEGIPRLRPRS